MPARSVCLVTLSLSEAGPGRFGGLNFEHNINNRRKKIIPNQVQPKYPRASCVAITGMSNQQRVDAPRKVGLDNEPKLRED